MHSRILITGHPRCGTAYMAALFQRNGYDVLHEHVGRDGTSNWQMAVCDESYPFPGDEWRRQDMAFDNLFHVIRNPLDAINSIAHTERRSEYFRAQYVSMFGNEYQKAVMSLYGWNGIVRSQGAIPVVLELADKVFGFQDVEKANQREYTPIGRRELQMLVSNDAWQLFLIEEDRYLKLKDEQSDNGYRHFIR